jgi:hypothetical protein
MERTWPWRVFAIVISAPICVLMLWGLQRSGTSEVVVIFGVFFVMVFAVPPLGRAVARKVRALTQPRA